MTISLLTFIRDKRPADRADGRFSFLTRRQYNDVHCTTIHENAVAPLAPFASIALLHFHVHQKDSIAFVETRSESAGHVGLAFTATPITSADFNADGVVGGADFLQWQRGSGKLIGATHQEGDANRDGAVDAADLELWKGAFATPDASATAVIPEPATGLLGLAAAIVFTAHKKVRRSSRRT